MAVAVPRLPVESHFLAIGRMFAKNGRVVLTAPTGTGKSCAIPPYLLESLPFELAEQGHFVIVSEPRRILARQLAAWVASRRGEEVGQTVGYQTGIDRCVSAQTRIFFVTDGLQVFRELLQQTKRRAVLIIDELHEGNIHQEILLAEGYRAHKEGKLYRLFVMSATINAAGVARFLGDAPVLEIPGQMFPVLVHPPYSDCPVELVASKLLQGKKTLLLAAGKREISSFIGAVSRKLHDARGDAVLLPLHGEQTVADQQRCLIEYDRPLGIVATKVVESGMTIPGIETIVDTGRIRLEKMFNGVPGLFTTWISKDARQQRIGRGGRTCESEYYPCYDPENLKLHDSPEIERIDLTTAALRYEALTKRSFWQMRSMNKPPKGAEVETEGKLNSWGWKNDNREVTSSGSEAALLPCEASVGGLVLKGAELGVLSQALTIAVIIGEKGIVGSDPSIWASIYCPDEKSSDLLAQLKVYEAAQEALQAVGDDHEELLRVRKELRENGVNLRKLDSAIEKRVEFAKRVRRKDVPCDATAVRENILTAIRTGLGGDYFIRAEGGWVGRDNVVRTLLGSSIVSEDAQCLFGFAWNLDLENDEPGPTTSYLIKYPSVVYANALPTYMQRQHADRRKEEHRELSLAGKKNKERRNRLPRNCRSSRN